MVEVFRIIYPNSHIYWFKIGTRDLHREDGPAFIDIINGHKEWHQNNLLHRLDGPAIEWDNGNKEWYQNGLLHRLDGPAVEWYGEQKDWFFEGKLIVCNSQEEFERLLKLKAFW